MAAPKLDAWGGGGIMERREGYGADGAAGNVVPLSCSTRLSNDVLEHIRRAKLGAAALEFCLYMHRKTFGDAGYHRKQGREETGCAFDLAQWAAEIPSDRSNVRRVRDQLAACGILTFEADPAAPGCGTVAWNVRFEEWRPYDGRRAPKSAPKQPDMVISDADQGKITMLARSKQPRSVDQNNYARPLKITMLDSREAGNEAGPESLLRKGEIKGDSVTIVTGAATSAAPAPVDAPPSQKPAKAAKPKRKNDFDGEEQRYVRELVEAVRQQLHLRKFPNEAQERAGAHWFYKDAMPDGTPAPIADVLDCYAATKRDQFWQGTFLSLLKLKACWVEYLPNPAAYKQRIARKATPPKARAAPPPGREPVFVPANAGDIWT